MTYCRQSSLILYFLSAAGRTFQHGSSRLTLKLLNWLSPVGVTVELEAELTSRLCVSFEADGVEGLEPGLDCARSIAGRVPSDLVVAGAV